MESKILYSLFESYGIQDTLPIVQKYTDEYNLKLYDEVIFKKRGLTKRHLGKLTSRISLLKWNLKSIGNMSIDNIRDINWFKNQFGYPLSTESIQKQREKQIIEYNKELPKLIREKEWIENESIRMNDIIKRYKHLAMKKNT